MSCLQMECLTVPASTLPLPLLAPLLAPLLPIGSRRIVLDRSHQGQPSTAATLDAPTQGVPFLPSTLAAVLIRAEKVSCKMPRSVLQAHTSHQLHLPAVIITITLLPKSLTLAPALSTSMILTVYIRTSNVSPLLPCSTPASVELLCLRRSRSWMPWQVALHLLLHVSSILQPKIAIARVTTRQAKAMDAKLLHQLQFASHLPSTIPATHRASTTLISTRKLLLLTTLKRHHMVSVQT